MSSKVELPSGALVLVVDDEELVREVAAMMVEDAGGKTVVAVDGADAIEKFKANVGKLHSVFMDFSMPRLDGFQAFEQMEKIDPSVPVVLVSGLRMTPEAEAARAASRLDFLNKPFRQDDVIRALVRSREKRNSGSAKVVPQKS